MNILSHLYLSGNNKNIILGNFIGDYVKGNKINDFPDEIALGIKIHREIDTFTDQHNIVKKVNNFYRERYNKYSGIVTDIIFDYFLTKTWPVFCKIEFDTFIHSRYTILNSQIKNFPEQVLEFYPFFVFNNWLKRYQSIEGIKSVLKGMSKRTSLPAEYSFAIDQVNKHHEEIESVFSIFFSEIIHHTISTFGIEIEYNKQPGH